MSATATLGKSAVIVFAPEINRRIGPPSNRKDAYALCAIVSTLGVSYFYLASATPEPGAATRRASALARLTTEQTMVLELTQGREATAGGYAEFVALVEKYAMGMGIVLANGQLSTNFRSHGITARP